MNQKPGMAFWFTVKLTMAEVRRIAHRKNTKDGESLRWE